MTVLLASLHECSFTVLTKIQFTSLMYIVEENIELPTSQVTEYKVPNINIYTQNASIIVRSKA